MFLFAASVGIVIIVSAACSLAEAALYAVRLPYVRQLSETGSKAGQTLARLKANMEQPITAILIVNTVANTAGAAVAGAQARVLLGERWFMWFSLAFTAAVLFLSEIMPKIAGVAYNRAVARFIAVPLGATVAALYPIVWFVQRASRLIHPHRTEPAATEDDVRQLAAISAEEGSILPVEAELVKNVLKLNQVTARDILTPVSKVFRLPSDLTLEQVARQAGSWPYSRIPVHPRATPESLTAVVLRRDVLGRLAADDFGTTLNELATPLDLVSEDMPGHLLLRDFVKRRRHLVGVCDPRGNIVGVVSLEDVLESLIGVEIFDETDRPAGA